MKLNIKVEGMHCNGCKLSLENALKDNINVISANVSLEDCIAYIEVKENTKVKEIEKIVKKCGFKCVNIEEESK